MVYHPDVRVGWNMTETKHLDVNKVVAFPAISVVGALVQASCSTQGADLRYTLDGSVPDMGSPLFPGEGLVLARTAAVNVKAFHDMLLCSPTASLLLVV